AWEMEKVERAIRHQIEHWETFHYGLWAVTQPETGDLMGWCGLEFLPDTNETEVGYLLSRVYWGNGYATEAARASVEFGRDEIGLTEIIGLTDPRNIASQRVLEKSGLSYTRRQVYFGMEMFRFATQAPV
ncbi:MAG TPA: GNAT family N-acetyltransferase, partial [Anaerolineales bacterium]|nr:GNAT family N-acetyltransferase [Anaerolineales bacterium]